jgi:hypothetical protein
MHLIHIEFGPRYFQSLKANTRCLRFDRLLGGVPQAVRASGPHAMLERTMQGYFAMNAMQRRLRLVLIGAVCAVAPLLVASSYAEAAARSVHVLFNNQSDTALVRTNENLDHGCWTSEPPARIEANSSVSWQSESCGFATGTEGEADYSIPSGGTAHFHWDNPFAGSNSYDASTSVVGYTAAPAGDGSGDNSTITFNFDCSSATCDGIPDDWKKNGVTLDPGDGSGPKFIDLPNMGATVNTPDVVVQLDWMADNTHSHALTPAEIQAIVTAFANSPFVSRTGSVGINLHVDHGPNSTLNFATNQIWGTLSQAKQQAEVTNLGTGTINSYNWTAFDNIKNQAGGFTSTGRAKIFHYAMAAHQISNLQNSGISRNIPASDFINSLGSFAGFGTAAQRSATLMHELGHNLGLQHGGGDGINYKPDYLSVMNYSYQFNLTKGGVNIFDYSRAALAALNENGLTESAGVSPGAAGFAASHWCPATATATAGFVTVVDGSKPIDWNCNGITTDINVQFDVNNDSQRTILSGFNDWTAITFKGGLIGSGDSMSLPTDTPVDEITPDQAQQILRVDTTAPVTTETQSPPPNANGWNNTDVAVTLTATDDISGVARTEFDLDSAGLQVAPTPIVIAPEGIHALQFRSIDRAQNVEAMKHATIRIDRTPPEATIQYDPEKNEIVVTGRDALSGVVPGAIAPASANVVPWNDFGADLSEIRTYRIVDLAGNVLDMVMKVRRERHEMEIGILSLRYAGGSEDDGSKQDGKANGVVKNTIEFGQLRGRGKFYPLLAVNQEVRLRNGDEGSSFAAFWDVLHDETEIIEISTSGTQHHEKQGLDIIRIRTDRGKLIVEN